MNNKEHKGASMIRARQVRALARMSAAAAISAVLLASPAFANKAFVSNEKGNTVTVVDTDSWEVLTEFPVGNRPRGITISPDGKLLYVCVSDDNLIRVFDTDTYEELYTMPSGPDPELFVLHPSGNPLYIANEDDNLVTVVDIESHTRCWRKCPWALNRKAWASARMAKVVGQHF